MSDFFRKFGDLIFSREFIRFFSVAMAATVLNYSLFLLLFEYFNLNYLLSSAIGFISGVFLGFYLNSKYTFKVSQRSHKLVIKYYSVYLFSLGVSLLFMKIIVGKGGLDARIANVLAIGITFVTNYAGTRFWVFRKT